MEERTSHVIFDGEKARIKKSDFNICEAVRVGAAAALLFKGNIAVMSSDRELCGIKSAICAGVGKGGAAAVDKGVGFSALLSFEITHNALDGGMLLSRRDGTCAVHFFDKYGMTIPFKAYNKLKNLHSRLPEEVVAADLPEVNGKRCPVDDYINENARYDLKGFSLYFESKNTYLSACAKQLFENCGATLLPYPSVGTVSLSADRDGRSLWGRDERLHPVTKNELSALIIKASAETGCKETAYPYLCPTYCDNLCELFGVEYKKVYDIAGFDDTDARMAAAQNPVHFDALRGAVEICRFLKDNNMRLENAGESIPRGVTKVQNIWIPSSRTDYVMRRLSGRLGSAARVRVMPCVTGGVRLLVEASDEESADELCCFYKNEIYRLAENADS